MSAYQVLYVFVEPLPAEFVGGHGLVPGIVHDVSLHLLEPRLTVYGWRVLQELRVVRLQLEAGITRVMQIWKDFVEHQLLTN